VEATTVSDSDPIPAVFAPIHQLRNGAKFTDLNIHHFTPEEMVWLCKTILNQSQSSQFYCLEYAQRHNIPCRVYQIMSRGKTSFTFHKIVQLMHKASIIYAIGKAVVMCIAYLIWYCSLSKSLMLLRHINEVGMDKLEDIRI
jgi:hypothetical protein